MTVPPRAEERFLPSVDRLESAMQAARRAFAQSKFDEALHQLDATLRLKPEYDAAWLLRGHVLQKRRDLEGALSSFEQALKANEDSEEAWLGRANTLHDLGHFPEEVASYDRLLAIHPRSLEGWTDKGAALHAMEDYTGAIACYDKVLSFRPEHAAAWNNKGAALLRLGDVVGADRCLDEALHLDPDFFDAMANRILLLSKGHRHGETVIWADRALRIRETAWIWLLKGLAHIGLSESTLAVKAFERALALDPKLRQARAGLRKAQSLREKVDFYRGVYECFGTHLEGDLGCGECEIRMRCREVTP
ncbi:MAG TPA: tetratricopeptide repeat protein [Thermoplasmata archaeon]|nr:tetratricopeptide repeat protein [Thermoplasmata archaeon]